MQTVVESPLHSLHLWTARITWVLVCAVVVSLLVVNASSNVVLIKIEYQFQEARGVIQSFTSLQTFAEWLSAARWMVVLVYFAVALLITWRKSDDWFALAVSAALLMLAWGFVMRGDHTTWRYPRFLGELLPAFHMFLSQSTILSLAMLFFLFPEGQFVFRWHKWPAMLAVGVTILFWTADHYHQIKPENWNALGSFLDRYAWNIWGSLFIISSLVALAGQVYRYRHLATPTQQQQMKWVLVGLGCILVIPLISWPLEDFAGAWGSFVSIWIKLVVSAFLPVTIGFSILRYHLWDVDLFINRTLVYGTLTASILGIYGISVGLASAFVPVQNHWMLSIVSLGTALMLLFPIRPRLQAVVDRWLPSLHAGNLEEEPVERKAVGWPFRLAHLVWVATFSVLFWVAAQRMITQPDLILSIQEDFLVEESLKLPWLPADLFIPYIQIVVRIGVAVIVWLVAALIFWRKRYDGFALVISYTFMVIPFGQILSHKDYPILNLLSVLTLLTLAVFPFVFPDGRFIPRSTRWRAVLISTVLLIPSLVYAIVRVSRPDYTTDEWNYVRMMAALLVMLAAGLGSQVYRYRIIASPFQRLQTRWVLFGLGVQMMWILWLVLWITGLLYWTGLTEPLIALIMLHLSIMGTVVLPVTIGISILRYRLWDIDLLINRTLVFGGLTILVASTYVILVGVFGVLFQAGNNIALSVLATGLIAILFHPLRMRLQQVVNRVMYGDRDDPASVLSRLGQHLSQTGIPGEVLPSVLQDIAQALKLPYVAIRQYRPGGQAEEIWIQHGQRSTDVQAFPLEYQGQTVGQLWVGPRAPGETFTAQERRLLENIAHQAGAAVYAAQLTSHLQHSRLQLVTSREEERRRIRRDLHDGLGPQLATLSLKLDAARNYLAEDQIAADRLLQELKGQVGDAIQDIRRLVYELRPPALDQLGLAPALREYAAQQSTNGLQVSVETPELLPALPAAVEVAAYRIALEAMTNTALHAHASHCSVNLYADDNLCLEIVDNGVGIPLDSPAGVGLSSMRERTSELGGVFSLQSRPGEGTHLSIRIPISNPEI